MDSVPIVQSLALLLAYEGHRVDLFVVEPGKGNNKPEVNHENVKINMFQERGASNFKKLSNLIPRNLLFYFWIRRHFSEDNYNHVIGVDPSGLAISGFICLFKKIKFSYLSLELILFRDKNRMFRGYKLLESFFIHKVFRILIQDQMRLDLLRLEYGLRPDQFELFPNSPIGEGDCTRSYWLHDKLNLSHDTKIVLYMGTWSDEFNKNWIVDLANREIGDAVIVIQSRRKIDFNGLAHLENIIFFDGEDLRGLLVKKYGHSLNERFKVLKEYIKIVKKENNKGNIVIISTVSHKQKMREMARDQLINFMEINLICDPQICAIRDYKNIYNKIDEKSNECLPGVTESYEISDSAELLLNTADHSIEDSGNILLQNVLKIIFEIDVDITALHN